MTAREEIEKRLKRMAELEKPKEEEQKKQKEKDEEEKKRQQEKDEEEKKNQQERKRQQEQEWEERKKQKKDDDRYWDMRKQRNGMGLAGGAGLVGKGVLCQEALF